jgi:hypothetical protein
MTGSTQAKVKAREHFAKQMQRFTNIRIKQENIINQMLDHTPSHPTPKSNRAKGAANCSRKTKKSQSVGKNKRI